MGKKSLVIISFAFIFLLSLSIFSAQENVQDEKISFGKWLKGLWGKITGRVADFPRCTNECSTNGNTQCLGNGYQTCGNYDADSCSEWSSATSCLSGQSCSGGNCIQSCADSDGDGYGTGTSLSSCSGSTTLADCNDNNATINPGATEICGNNIDENCSGLVNEGCLTSCVANFTISSQKCFSNDVLEINWTDVNVCGLNYTQKSSCDFNGNNLFCESSPGVKDIGIGGNLINVSGNYTSIGVSSVELAQLGGGGVDFNWNFSESSLNFCDLSVEIAPTTSSFGYTIVKNVSAKDKIIWVERLNNSEKVCVKDIPGEISIGDFSSDCSKSNEILLSCPSESPYNCEIVESDNSSWFKIWPLNHSAAKEITNLATEDLLMEDVSCIENWNCIEWSNITDQCGTRTCADLNDCGTTFDKPFENQVCGEECIPGWTCTSFGKCVDGFKERTCTDSNNCGVDTDKPNETQECKKISPLIIALIIVGLLLVIFLIWYFAKMGGSEEESSEEGQTLNSSSPSHPSSPVVSRHPQLQHPQNRLAPRY